MKVIRLLLLLLFLNNAASSQGLSRWQIGIFGGAAAYNGDLTDKIFPKKVTNGAVAGTLSFEINPHFSVRGQLSYGVVGGADRYNKKPDLVARNLSFETVLYEAAILGEYNLQDLYQHRFTPYVFAGIGLFHFNPYTFNSAGDKIFLQQYRTEGQGLPGYPEKPYWFNQFNIPFGGGVKYAVTSRINVGLELGIRKLFTDFLDDVSGNYADINDLARISPISVDIAYRGDEVGFPDYPGKTAQRGSPDFKDIYYFTGLHVTFRLGSNSGFTGGGGRRSNPRFGCPTNVY